MFASGKMLLCKRLEYIRILMIFLMYLFRWRKWGALMHVYELKHIVSLCYRTIWLILVKLDMDEELKAPLYMF